MDNNYPYACLSLFSTGVAATAAVAATGAAAAPAIAPQSPADSS
jgi:hypothetical protein